MRSLAATRDLRASVAIPPWLIARCSDAPVTPMESVACTVAALTAGAACFCCGKVQQQAIAADAVRRSAGGNVEDGQNGGLWSFVAQYSVLAGTIAMDKVRRAVISAAAAASSASAIGGIGGLGPLTLPPAEPLPVPDSFKCPITQEAMRDPVTTVDGQSYERASIAAWFQQGRRTSPLTNNPLGSLALTENVALRGAIAEFHLLQPFVDAQRQQLEEVCRGIHAHSGQREFELTSACDLQEARAREMRGKLDDSRLQIDILKAQLDDALQKARSFRNLADERGAEVARSSAEVQSLRKEVSSLQAAIKEEREEAEFMAVRAKSQKFGVEAALLRAQVEMLREELAVPGPAGPTVPAAAVAATAASSPVCRTQSNPRAFAVNKDF